MNMVTPPYLKAGDTVAIISPARKVLPEEMEHGIQLLISWGLKVVTGDHLYCEHHQFAGTDEQRLKDFQCALDNPDIKAVFAARGGYGGVRILDKLDFTRFIENPKWLCGYSDFTYFISHLNSVLGIEAIHGPMPFRFQDEISTSSLRNLLFGGITQYHEGNEISIEYNQSGIARGRLIGGNLSILYALNGSISDIKTDQAILFLEDLDEYLYHIDRMMFCLKRAGKLENLNGLIIGGMSEMRDNAIPFGMNVFEIISESVKEYSFPVGFGFSAGHIQPNFPMIMGREVELEVDQDKTILRFT